MLLPLSKILVEKFEIAEEDLLKAEKVWKENKGAIGNILTEKKIITEWQLLEAYSLIFDMPFLPELPLDSFDTGFTQQVPIQYLKKHLMVPIQQTGLPASEDTHSDDPEKKKISSRLSDLECLVAINNPAAFQELDDLVKITGLTHFKTVLATKSSILNVINLAYDLNRDSAEDLVHNMTQDEDSIVIGDSEVTADLLEDASDAPIIRLVNHIISQSIKGRASDIHIEPYQNSFKVRYRVDGILYDLLTPPKWIQASLISRLKVMAKLDIAEKRLPQDGRIDIKIGDQEVDIRVSTIPTSFGERVVLRLLNKSGILFKLPDLGLTGEKFDRFKQIVKSPNGIILVTGPTGSGKTTTLYAVLSSINSPDINIITIEDPVEYKLTGISQIQVNPKIDLTFAKGLRSIVRQDPDVILVGEIRDKDTAEIAVQSALTGHLVFSTLHTNDSASAITRLVDIGVEPFLISSSVVAVVAQRLIRKLCNECKTAYQPELSALESIGVLPEHSDNNSFFKANGCEYCLHTGYRGRIGIFEILVIDDYLKSLILKTYDSNHIKQEAVKKQMTTLRQDGISKVFEGITTIEEVVRVTL